MRRHHRRTALLPMLVATMLAVAACQSPSSVGSRATDHTPHQEPGPASATAETEFERAVDVAVPAGWSMVQQGEGHGTQHIKLSGAAEEAAPLRLVAMCTGSDSGSVQVTLTRPHVQPAHHRAPCDGTLIHLTAEAAGDVQLSALTTTGIHWALMS